MAQEADRNRQAEFERIYLAYRRHIHAYCARRLLARDAADTASEIFLTAWRRIEKVPGEPDTLPYLYGIASRTLANRRRSIARTARLNRRLESIGLPPSEDPVTSVVRNDAQAEVARALKRLKPQDRELVMLDTWEELTKDQIAAATGFTTAAVDQRLRRAYRRLARTLGARLEAHNTSPIAENGGGA